jgi:hypothetical protein
MTTPFDGAVVRVQWQAMNQTNKGVKNAWCQTT